jgi:cold shock CspA family protein
VSGTTPHGARATGSVAAFDARRGLGEVALDDGRTIDFHATQVADGTRAIEVGQRVTLSVVPWHAGKLEGTDVARSASRG